MFVESYIKTGERFVPIREFQGIIVDPDYIEGAIEVRINGVDLITQEMWDYVDQLWEYLIDLVTQAVAGQEASVFFPDQPIEVKACLSWGGDGIDIEVIQRHKRHRTTVDLAAFLGVFCQAGKSFFEKMREVNPEHKEANESVLRKIDALQR
jgi:hypothetical protein